MSSHHARGGWRVAIMPAAGGAPSGYPRCFARSMYRKRDVAVKTTRERAEEKRQAKLDLFVSRFRTASS